VRLSRYGAPSGSLAGVALLVSATAGLTRVVSVAISLFMSLVVVPQAWIPGFGSG
jgi:hypothetical protein